MTLCLGLLGSQVALRRSGLSDPRKKAAFNVSISAFGPTQRVAQIFRKGVIILLGRIDSRVEALPNPKEEAVDSLAQI